MPLTHYDVLAITGWSVFPTEDPGARDRHDGSAVEAAKNLRSFITMAWPVVEPATPFISGWHLDAICEHLMAVTRGEIRNLLINIPPRHMKSLAVGVFWPAWEWTTAPHRRWLFASYALSLSERDSLRCRRLIESPWYQRHWGDRFALCGDQNTKLRYENNHAGHRIATSVGAAATGEGGDYVVVDDPHNVIERESDAARIAALMWWDETMSTRLNNPKTGAKIIVMQRIHEKDLSGHVLQQGGYIHLNLPAEFELSRRCVTVIGIDSPRSWSDPRGTDGDLLWEQRIGDREIADFKVRLGPEGYAGQFQQRPSPAGGGRFKAEWFRYYRGGDADCVGSASRTVSGESTQEYADGSDDAGWLEGGRPRPPSAVSGGRGRPPSKTPEIHESDADARAIPEDRSGPMYILLQPDGSSKTVSMNDCNRIAVMDPAGTEPGEGRRPCYTVIQVWDVTPIGEMLLVYQYRKQVQAPDAAAAAVKICREFDVEYIAIEKDGMGLGVVQHVRRESIAVRAIKARGSKEARSQTAEIRMAAGSIYFPARAPFLFELEEELLQFPNSEYADQADALSHAAIQVQRMRGMNVGPTDEINDAPEQHDG